MKTSNPRASSAFIRVRVTPAEKQAIEKSAKHEGVTISQFVREAVEERVYPTPDGQDS